MSDNPLVSILVNNYNYAPFLREAIDSALGQTYSNIEVVVVDDGSTDNSREIIAGYGTRIVPVLQENGGQASAFNSGFSASRGDIVCFLDSDDVFFPDKVDRVVDVFRRFPDAGWLRHKLEVTDEALHPLGGDFPDIRESGLIRREPHGCLEHKTRYLTSGMALRRSVGTRVFPIPLGQLSYWVGEADCYVAFWSGMLGAGYSLASSLGYYRRQSRHRSVDRAELVRMQERQILLDQQLSDMWSGHVGVRRTATTVFKHRLILASLNGQHTWSPQRWGMLGRGLIESSKFALIDPPLAARQATALLFAFGSPRVWIRKLMRAKWVQPAAQQVSSGSEVG